MKNQSLDDAIRGLRDVLLEERSFLKSGLVHDVVSLTERKLEALEVFEGMLAADPPARISGTQRQSVQEVRQMARENGLIMQSVRNGLRSAADRLANLDGGATVGAYDRYGAKMPFSGATGGYVKRV